MVLTDSSAGTSGRPPWQTSAMLEVLGLDGQVGKVYDVLLEGRPFTVRELAEAAGLSATRVRTALRRLESLELVTRQPGSPPGYIAVDPSFALDRLLLEREEQLRQARVRSQEAGDRFRQAAAGRDPAKLVEFVTGREQIIRRYDQIQRSARRDLRAFVRPPFQPGCDSDAELALLEQGVRVRIIYDSATADQAAAFIAAGGEARTLPSLPISLLVVDERLAVVPLQNSTNTPSTCNVVVHKSALLDALTSLFETIWRQALPLGPAGSTPNESDAPGPGPVERRILGLMNAGLPDEAIARQLGLSHRTLQRRVHALMRDLNAATRYQLGAQAVARGWCAPPDD